jgi:DNA-binding protein HU-beta
MEKVDQISKGAIVNRKELVNKVALQSDITNKEADNVLKAFQDVVTAYVAKGEPINISGFCKFVKVNRPARMGRNPATGEAIKIKASKKARITPLKAFKDSVLSGKGPKLNKGV